MVIVRASVSIAVDGYGSREPPRVLTVIWERSMLNSRGMRILKVDCALSGLKFWIVKAIVVSADTVVGEAFIATEEVDVLTGLFACRVICSAGCTVSILTPSKSAVASVNPVTGS